VPSLYKYVEATGGSRALYGVAAAIDSFCGIFFLPLYGYLADRYSPKVCFTGALLPIHLTATAPVCSKLLVSRVVGLCGCG
jgi:MFS family permease